MHVRSILLAALAGLAVSGILHSTTLAFATLTASVIATLVATTHRRIFAAVTFDRSLSRRVVSWGGELEITISISNDKLLPLVWIRVCDEWPTGLEPQGFRLSPMSHLGRQAFVQTVSVRWYERLRRRYRVRCVERGLHRFGPVELEAGDPFGIGGVEQAVEARQELTVLPRVLSLPASDLVTGRPMVSEAAVRSLVTDPTALRDTRIYRRGDPLRAIDWRATARVGSLHTKEFDPASLAAMRLLLDVESTRKAWQVIDPDLMELLCVVAASVAAAFADQDYAVGLASNASLTHERRTADIQAAYGALPEVLETLARLSPYAAGDYGSVITAELADETGSADCVVITAKLRPAVRSLIARLRAERPTTVVFVGRPDEAELPFADFAIPADFAWRTSDALPLRA